MSQTLSLTPSPQTRQALQEIVDDRSEAIKHVLCARIVLLSDAPLPVLDVARRAGVSRPMELIRAIHQTLGVFGQHLRPVAKARFRDSYLVARLL